MALVKDKDYTITYKNNIYPGYATYTVKGIRSAGYDGEISMTYRILPRNIFRATVEMADGVDREKTAVFLILLIALTFTAATFFPPQIPFFEDPITGSYGFQG